MHSAAAQDGAVIVTAGGRVYFLYRALLRHESGYFREALDEAETKTISIELAENENFTMFVDCTSMALHEWNMT